MLCEKVWGAVVASVPKVFSGVKAQGSMEDIRVLPLQRWHVWHVFMELALCPVALLYWNMNWDC